MRRLLLSVLSLSFLAYTPLKAHADNTETITFDMYSLKAVWNSGYPSAPLVGSGQFTVDYDHYTAGGFAYGDPGFYQVTDLSYNITAYDSSSSSSASYSSTNPFPTGSEVGFEDTGFGYYYLFFDGHGGDPLYIYSDMGPNFQLDPTNQYDFGYLGVSTFNGPPLSATPEPSSLALLGTGLVGAMGFARRRFRRA